MIKVHVDRHSLSETEPPFIIDTGRQKFATANVFFLESSMLVWRPNEPLDCGATAWLETEGAITFLDAFGLTSTVYPGAVASNVLRAGGRPCGCGQTDVDNSVAVGGNS